MEPTADGLVEIATDSTPNAPVVEEALEALATNGHRPEALQALEDYLHGSPHDPDARVLYGLVLSWEGRYDDARRQFGLVDNGMGS